MPVSKQKPSEIAAEAKRRYIPYCEVHYANYLPNSRLYPQAQTLLHSPRAADPKNSRLKVAVIIGDAVDVAFDWYDFEASVGSSVSGEGQTLVQPIPVVNAANEKKPGGDWELGLVAPEENFCRRSNLVHCLNSPWPGQVESNYPLPNYGGIYSPNVVVFRSGPDKSYAVWPEFRRIPVISVAPARRPKLDESGERYSFEDEANHVKNKMRTILRIAADQGHPNLVIGPWGLGPLYRNPPKEMARMWNDILFKEKEFENRFENIVFALDTPAAATETEKGTGQGAERGPEKGAEDQGVDEFEIFRQGLGASNVHKSGFLLRTQ